MKPPHAIGVRGRKILQMLKILTPPKPRFFGISDPPGPQILINPGPPISKRKRDPPRDPDFGVPPPEPRFRGTPPDPRFRGTPENPDFGDPPRNPRFWGTPPGTPISGYPPRDPRFRGPPPDRGGPPPPPETPISGTPPGRGYPPGTPISGTPDFGVPPPTRGIPQFFVSPGSKKTVFLQHPLSGEVPRRRYPPRRGGYPPTHFLRGPPPKCVISNFGPGGGPPAYIYSIYILYRLYI